MISKYDKQCKIVKERKWIIKEADKNLGLVLMSQEAYHKLLETETKNGFTEVESFPHGVLLSRLQNITNNAKQLSKGEKRHIMENAAERKYPSLF